MHELGLMAEIVDKIEAVAKENNVTEIETLVLDIGEYSGVVPEYVEECYPAVIEGTLLEKTTLKINVIPGKARCESCGTEFAVKGNENCCPRCGSQKCKVTEGGEFIIKEIVAR